MYAIENSGINDFLVKASQLLLKDGVKRETRGYVCYELPEPALFKINNPTARIVTIKERKWNKTLPYAESLWIASGRNDLDYICSYLKKMKDFSDDGVYMRGGYGPRLRHYNGETNDYQIKDTASMGVDQLRYVSKCFEEDSETRRATIVFGDINKDCFSNGKELKHSKDIPCTRELHFMKQANINKLDLVVKMRSNDLIWGASAVNIFNYTFMLEYMASIIGMEVGNYYHFVDNLHYYEQYKGMVKLLAQCNRVEDVSYKYQTTFHSLEDFDYLLNKLCEEESSMKKNPKEYKYFNFTDSFFRDWYNILYAFNTKRKVSYTNNLLNEAV